jgi:chromosome segregation ATPase
MTTKTKLAEENEKLLRESLARGTAVVDLKLQLNDALRELGLSRAYVNRYRRQRDNAKMQLEAARKEVTARKREALDLQSEIRLLRKELIRKDKD